MRQTPPQPFALVDQTGKVVVDGGRYHIGDQVPASTVSQGTSIKVNGQVVGAVLATGNPPQQNPLEARYLARTNQSLLIAALGATVLALLLGAVLARTITRPVRELTAAAHAMTRGMSEESSVSGLGNDAAGAIVNFACPYSFAHRFPRRFLRLPDNGIYFLLAYACLSHHKGPCHIGGEPGYGAPEVAQGKIAPPKPAV
jgi:hypothetical protein